MPCDRPTSEQTRRACRQWLAVWNERSGYALDVFPEEVERCRRDLASSGDRCAGPFASAEMAQEAVRQILAARLSAQPKTKPDNRITKD